MEKDISHLLIGRTARCCTGKSEKPSSVDLAFFEYRGPNYRKQCDVCGYHEIVHTDPNSRPRRHRDWRDHEWTNAEGRLTDSYYCGCRGWD